MKMFMMLAFLMVVSMLRTVDAYAAPLRRLSIHNIYGGSLDIYRLSSYSDDGSINVIIPANEKVADKLKEIFSKAPPRTSFVCDVKYFPFLLHDGSKYASVFHLQNCTKSN